MATRMSQLGDAPKPEQGDSNKRRKTSDQLQQPHLVLCFSYYTREVCRRPTFYKFESYSFQKLLTTSSNDHHEEDSKSTPQHFTWCGAIHDPDNKVFPPYRSMGLFNIGNSLFAFGGHMPVGGHMPLVQRVAASLESQHLSTNVYCTTLSSTPVPTSSADFKVFGKMNSGKYAPLIASCQDRIYVLSSADSYRDLPIQHVFEVYDPKKDEWTPLPAPPELARFDPVIGFSFVVGTQIFFRGPAHGHGSYVYDVDLGEWFRTKLFSDSLSYLISKPVVYGDRFLLCRGPDCSTPVIAFELCDATRRCDPILEYGSTETEVIPDKKAVKVAFEFDQTFEEETGEMEDLFHLKDDYFVGMFRSSVSMGTGMDRRIDYKDDLTMVSFKLHQETKDDALKFSGEILSQRSCNLNVIGLEGSRAVVPVHAFLWDPL